MFVVLDDIPLSVVLMDLPMSGLSIDLPVSVVSNALPVSMVSNALPVSMVSDALPVSMVSDALPVSVVSDDLPVSVVSDDLPMSVRSDDLPVSVVSDDLPALPLLEHMKPYASFIPCAVSNSSFAMSELQACRLEMQDPKLEKSLIRHKNENKILYTHNLEPNKLRDNSARIRKRNKMSGGGGGLKIWLNLRATEKCYKNSKFHQFRSIISSF